MPTAMKDRIWARIEDLGPGKAFMAKDFLDIASRGSIDVALASLTRAKTNLTHPTEVGIIGSWAAKTPPLRRFRK